MNLMFDISSAMPTEGKFDLQWKWLMFSHFLYL